MADIVTGLMGIAIMTTFVSFVMTRIGDAAFWVVCAVSFALMVFSWWRDAVIPVRRARYDRVNNPPPTV